MNDYPLGSLYGSSSMNLTPLSNASYLSGTSGFTGMNDF